MTTFELQNTSWEWWIRPKTAYCNGRMWLGGLDDAGMVRVDVIAGDNTCRRATVENFGTSGTASDDHNSSAILAVPGKVPLIFYSKHDNESAVHYKRGTTDAANGFRPLGPVQYVSFAGGATNAITVSYVHVFYVNDTVHLLTRIRASTGPTNQGVAYGYARSTDWGVTWSAPQLVVTHALAVVSMYPAMQNVNGVLRIGFTAAPAGTHGLHDVYYCELNLATGDIYKPEAPGTVLGNVQTGVGTPVAYTAVSKARVTSAGLRTNFFDTSGGTIPQITWVEMNEANTQGTGMYYMASFVSGAWVVNSVCSSGQEFGNSKNGTGGYMGGCHFTNVANSDLILSRQVTLGNWTIERWHSNDYGATWSTPTVIASDTVPLVRPFQIEGAGAWKAVYERITRYGTDLQDLNGYNDWKASLIVTDQ